MKRIDSFKPWSPGDDEMHQSKSRDSQLDHHRDSMAVTVTTMMGEAFKRHQEEAVPHIPNIPQRVLLDHL